MQAKYVSNFIKYSHINYKDCMCFFNWLDWITVTQFYKYAYHQI